MLYILPTIDNIVEECTITKLSELVDIPYKQIERYYKKYISGAMTEDEARKALFETVVNMRYAESDYFWIHTYDSIMIMHPVAPQLIDQNIDGLEDPNGVFFIQEMNKVVNKDGEGIVHYMWNKPDEEEPSPKISYVRGFKDWNMIVGTGICVGDLVEIQRSIYLKVLIISAIIILVSIVLVLIIVRQ